MRLHRAVSGKAEGCGTQRQGWRPKCEVARCTVGKCSIRTVSINLNAMRREEGATRPLAQWCSAYTVTQAAARVLRVWCTPRVREESAVARTHKYQQLVGALISCSTRAALPCHQHALCSTRLRHLLAALVLRCTAQLNYIQYLRYPTKFASSPSAPPPPLIPCVSSGAHGFETARN